MDGGAASTSPQDLRRLTPPTGTGQRLPHPAPPPAARPAYPDPHERPREYRSLGLLKNANDPHFRHFEHQFLSCVRRSLTTYWGLIQSGRDREALRRWSDIFLHLELDQKAQQDIRLLAHLGEAGRAEANEVLWKLLSHWALIPEYRDLSNKASSLVREAREHLDRPPADNPARGQWRWQRYWTPRHKHFSPFAVPQRHTICTGAYGEPLPPPL